MCGEKGYQSMEMVKYASLIGRKVVNIVQIKENFMFLPPLGAIWRFVAPGYNLRYFTVYEIRKLFFLNDGYFTSVYI